jgi:hypothetical protein
MALTSKAVAGQQHGSVPVSPRAPTPVTTPCAIVDYV